MTRHDAPSIVESRAIYLASGTGDLGPVAFGLEMEYEARTLIILYIYLHNYDYKKYYILYVTLYIYIM